MHRTILPLGAALFLSAAFAGCSGDTAGPASDPSTATAELASARVVEVHRSPGCSCCHEWEAYLRTHGYEVDAADDPDIVAFKAAHGVPGTVQSCHTALIEGYVVEGHVPVEAIEDLLARRYDIDGIILAGMPAGSPGMPGELEGGLEVLALADGQVTPFGSY